MRIRKHGGSVDINKNGSVIITPFLGQPVVIDGDVEITGDTEITGDVTEVITEAELSLADNTTNNSSAAKHGFLKKLSNVATDVLTGQGNWASIAAILGFTPADAAAVPVKATGAEIDTGTDDVKFATAKAIADSGLASETYVNTEAAQRIGNDAQYVRTTDGAQTLLGGNAVARAVIIIVEVDTTFAAGDGAAPSFDIGETGNLTKFTSGLNTGTAGDKLIFAGFLSANTALIITATAATGATSTGAIHVTALTLPEA